MRKHHRKKAAGQSLYPYEPWQITETEYKVENNHHNEAIFALGNGYMGVRGTLEEEYSGPEASTTPGVYINGVYGSEEIIYGEKAADLPEKSQTMLNLADWTVIDLYINNEKFDMLTGRVSCYQRTLNMKEGTLTRELIWESPSGKKLQINIVRFISLVRKHTAAVKYSFTPLNFSGKLKVVTAVDGDVRNYHYLNRKKALTVREKGFAEDKGFIIQQADSTGISTGTVMVNRFSSPGTEFEEKQYPEEDRVAAEFELTGKEGCEYSLTKFINLFSSEDIEEGNLKNTLLEQIEIVNAAGWEELLNEHKEFLADYWEDVDVKIYGDMALQQAFRFNALHLLQSTGRGGRTNVAAKGLTGEFYEGHYFWDTETYIVPFFLYSKPEMARDLLLYRYNTLEQARVNARRMKLDGVLFPWRTIDGKEASGFFMGSTVQYHIDADIAFALYQYFNATDDYDFLFNYGAEILVETARMWVSRGSYISLRGNKFCLNEVCGPDEYKPGVNNNCYTNYMARFNLDFAVDVIELMEKDAPDKLKGLRDKVNLSDSELTDWKKAARNMYLPYNEELDIHPQDDSFLYKDPIDIDSIPESDIPLVKNWHPLIIWRYQVIKQADVVLLMLLLGDRFSSEEKKANYDYYEPRTTHDSSLSPAIYSILASEIGYHEQAYNYFIQTARLDLDDYNDNAYQGVHTACMAGSWLALVQGFAGMRNYNGKLHFNPYLPAGWEGYQFKVKFKGRQIKIDVNRDGVSYQLIYGEELTIVDRGKERKLVPVSLENIV